MIERWDYCRGNVKQCLQAGMNAHLAKPVDIDQLKEKLAELLPPRP